MSGGSQITFARTSLVLFGLVWTVPFLQPHHRYPLTAFYSEWLAFALGLAAALLLLRRESWREANVPRIALAPFALMLLIGLQVALDRVPYPEQALTATLYLLWVVVLVQLAQVLKRELGLASIAQTLAWFAFAGGLLAAFAGLLQHYQFATPFDSLIARKVSPAVYGNVGQPNHYATYLTLAVASAVYLHAQRALRAVLALPCVALLLFMTTLAASRGPWIYFIALAVLALLLHRSRRDAESRRLAVAALWLLPGFAVAQWAATLELLQPREGAVLTSLQRLFESAGGLAARLQLAGEALRMFVEAPVLGAGFGQFAWHHFLLGPPAEVSRVAGVFDHAHNIVLHLMAESGLVGVCVVAGAALYWLAGARRAVLDLAWWWMLAVLAVIAIHSLLEYPLWYSYFLGPAAFLLGLGAVQVFPVGKPALGHLAAAAALAIGWLNAVSVIVSYRDFERLVFETRDDALRPDERSFADAIMRVHKEPLLRPYVELALTFGIAPSREELREKLELNTRVMHFAPIDLVVYRQALLLALSGQREGALRQLELAMRAYPGRLDDFAAGLVELARRQPGELTPLLELAAARRAERRARSAAQ